MPSKRADGVSRISDYVKNVAGMKGLKVVKSIGDGATDETIEQQTKFKMAEIRAMLNVLHNHGIVEYNREKNLQTGWFTYTWRVNADRAFKNFISLKRKEYVQLRDYVTQGENSVFYECRKGCNRMPFDNAMESQFSCPKCEGKMNAVDNKRELQDHRKKIGELGMLLDKFGELPEDGRA